MVIRRAYSRLRCFEVLAVGLSTKDDDNSSEAEDVFPVFSVESNGVEYGTLNMGRGELSAAYLLWRLARIPDNSIVILEEPENHLAAFSQRRLMEMLVHLSVKRGLSFILSSHSPQMFQQLPDGYVSLAISSPNLTVMNGYSSTFVSTHLGLPMQPVALLVAEDHVAGILASRIVRQYDDPLLDAVSIFFDSDGESGVRRTVAKMVSSRDFRAGKPHKILGVLDGDQRSSRAVDDGFLYLPGSLSPEESMRAIVSRLSSGASELSFVDQAQNERLLLAMSAAEGEDGHDWLRSLGGEYGSLVAAVDVLFAVCIRDESFEADAIAFVSSLKSALDL